MLRRLRRGNLELFRRYGVRKIVTICPHGFNTFKNEYPKLLDHLAAVGPEAKAHYKTIDVFHHATFLAGLVREGRLKVRANREGSLAYHDPCYLGRHNGILDEPRNLLSEIGGRPAVELENSREHSFCCGAGGGLMWTEESLGKRINHLRADEVIRAGAGGLATACPFCQTMLRDALKDKEKGDIQVKDLAVLLAESIAD